MPEGNLKCNATNCLHNRDYECKTGAINISGNSAISIDGTTCTTFIHKAKSSFVNSVDDLTTEVGNIKCEVHNCVHNENKGCHADNVEIGMNNACCNTFKYE